MDAVVNAIQATMSRTDESLQMVLRYMRNGKYGIAVSELKALSANLHIEMGGLDGAKDPLDLQEHASLLFYQYDQLCFHVVAAIQAKRGSEGEKRAKGLHSQSEALVRKQILVVTGLLKKYWEMNV